MIPHIEVTQEATVEPVTLETVKSHCNIDADITKDDALLMADIAVAREYGESLTCRSWAKKSLRLTMCQFPSALGPIELKRPPLVSVDSVEFVGYDGVKTTIAPETYVVVSGIVPAIVPVAGIVWPQSNGRPDSVIVNYTAGYDDLPKPLQQWLLVRVSGLYEQRENFVVGTGGLEASSMPRDFVDGLLDAYTIPEGI